MINEVLEKVKIRFTTPENAMKGTPLKENETHYLVVVV